MIRLAEILWPRPEPMWALLRQCGITDVVAFMRGAEQEKRIFASLGEGAIHRLADADPEPWGEAALARDKALFAEHGFRVAAIEDTPPLEQTRLGLPGRDAEIDCVITQIRAMGRLEIPVLCYNWMARASWSRTDIAVTTRGGALVTGFDGARAADLPPLCEPGEFSHEQMWQALGYFLNAVLPEAEAAGVRLAMHPCDPPLEVLRNMPRIMTSPAAFDRMIALNPSPANAVTFCQGTFGLMGQPLPDLIRHFGGQGRIAFVHMREVRGTRDRFVETFHDDGPNDLAACFRAYHETGFSGPLRPDHVPSMEGEPADRPGYGVMGRLFAVGYLRGLLHGSTGRGDSAQEAAA